MCYSVVCIGVMNTLEEIGENNMILIVKSVLIARLALLDFLRKAELMS